MNEVTRKRLASAMRAISRPAALAELLMTRRGRARIRYVFTRHGQGKLDQSQPVAARAYHDSESYRSHQRSKLALLDLSDYNERLRSGLAGRLKQQGEWAGRSVLCLAARLGGEVSAFHAVGAFSVGVDLNPGEANSLVLPGDFHSLVFPDGCLDVAYCNSLDHCLDISMTLNEIRRILKPTGIFLVDAQLGAAEATFDEWAATSWRSIDDLMNVIIDCGFVVNSRCSITVPWTGECIQFGVGQGA